ncbi:MULTISPECIES: hypothetical protein [Citrobacter]|uniref:hypothetical protein n=1 Tax=Citrobacter TaxID=544 RepID=UPI0023A9BAFC|nr:MULTISPECIES: hypothetical protein [Citrobacter]MDM3392526.1 hypothetical protein [Citrobacter sp. Cb014]WEA77609.1 hypothetical protein PXN04_13505 [Citrobacter braakii]
MTHNKKWVFSELVKDSNDLSQLIAYAIYKADKDSVANGCRAQGKTEEEIQEALDAYHDSVATTLRLQQSCHDRAAVLMTTVANGIVADAKQKADQKIAAIEGDNKKALAKEGKKAVEEYHKKIKQSVAQKQTKWEWFKEFTVSGFSGVWATIVLIVAVWIISMAAAPKSERDHLTGNLFQRMWNYVNSSPLPEAEAANATDTLKATSGQLAKP